MPLRDYLPETVSVLTAGAVVGALLWQWPAAPPRADVEAELTRASARDRDLRQREKELSAVNETKNPQVWMMHALMLSSSYAEWRARTGDREALLKRCLAVQETWAEPDPDETSMLRGMLGQLYADSGRPAEALPLQEGCLKYLSGKKTPPPGTCVWQAAVAQSLRGLGRTDEALAAYHRTLQMPDAVQMKWEKVRWLRAYCEILTEKGKTPDEIRRHVRAEFGEWANPDAAPAAETAE